MHPMERAIVEKLKLESGDNFLFSIKGNAVGMTKEGKIGTVFLDGIFRDIIGNEQGAVIVYDSVGAENRVLHCALNVDDISQVGKISEVSLHTVQ